MNRNLPDERRDFFGWTVERFGDECFVNFTTGAPAGVDRTKIAREEFDAAMAGERKLSDLVPRGARRDPLLEKTPEWTKIALFITVTICVGGMIAVALIRGWEWL